MERKIEIVLNAQPPSGSFFRIILNLTSELQTLNSQFSFNTAGITSGDLVGIGLTLSQTVTNLYNNCLEKYASFPYITTVKNLSGVTISIRLPEASSSTFTISGVDASIVHSTIVDPPGPDPEIQPFTRSAIILSRSPRFVNISPAADFDEAVMNLKIWRGDFIFDKPATTTYSLSKLVVQAGQSQIVFDIHDLVNGYVKANIGVFGNTGSFTSSDKESVWVEAEITAKYQGVDVGSVTKSYMAVDGFGWHTEGSNPILKNNVLSSITDHIFYSGTSYPIYFVTDKLISIVINGVTVPFTFNQDFNNQVIAFVNVAAYAIDGNTYSAVFTYQDDIVETHKMTMKSECTFDVVNCFFKNKFGYWQNIPFSKLSKDSLTVESDDYSPIISNFGDYSLQSHNKKQYLFTGKEKKTANTDFISEKYNVLFDELLLSESVYIQQNDGIFYPVNLLTRTFEKKTKLNNKLVQYTMEFEFSYNKMNIVI